MNKAHFQPQTNAIGVKFKLPHDAAGTVSYEKGDLVWWFSNKKAPSGQPKAAQ